MTDRIPADHDAVETHRVHLAAVGSTSRCRLPLPDALAVETGDVLSLSLEGERTHADVTETLGGDLAVDGAFANARLARSAGEGTDHLAAWLAEADLAAGDALQLDVLTPGYAYGLRRPGERVVYDVPEPPDEGLAAIARDVED